MSQGCFELIDLFLTCEILKHMARRYLVIFFTSLRDGLGLTLEGFAGAPNELGALTISSGRSGSKSAGLRRRTRPSVQADRVPMRRQDDCTLLRTHPCSGRRSHYALSRSIFPVTGMTEFDPTASSGFLRDTTKLTPDTPGTALGTNLRSEIEVCRAER